MTKIMVDTFHCSIKMARPAFLSGPYYRKSYGIPASGWYINDKGGLEKKAPFGDATITLIFYDNVKTNKPQLNIEVTSLPKIFHPNNYQYPTEFPKDFDQLNLLIEEEFKVKIDIQKASLFRADFSTVFPVGEKMSAYLAVIRQLHQPHRYRKQICSQFKGIDNSIEFETKSKKIKTKFYDKGEQCGDAEAKGLLRFEVSIISRSNLKNYIPSKKMLVSDLSRELAIEILNSALEALGLNKSFKHKYSPIEDMLSTIYKKRDNMLKFKGVFMEMCNNWDLSDRELAKHLGVSEKTIQTRREIIVDIGGPFLDFGDMDVDLPQLFIE